MARRIALHGMPVELLDAVVHFLPVEYHCTLAGVCHRWYEIVTDYRRRHALPLMRSVHYSTITQSLSLLRWAITNKPVPSSLAELVGTLAHLSFVSILVTEANNGVGWEHTNDGIVINAHAGAKHIRSNTFMRSLYREFPTVFFSGNAIDHFADTNNIDKIKWLRAQNCTFKRHTLLKAIQNGYSDLVFYAIDSGAVDVKFDSELMTVALLSNRIDIANALHRDNFPLHDDIYVYAANKDNRNAIVWLLVHNVACNKDVCQEAAATNNLELLKWLRARQFPWDKDTCEEAARQGNLALLKWAHENGCPWDDDTLYAAAEKGHLPILEYLYDNGFKRDNIDFS